MNVGVNGGVVLYIINFFVGVFSKVWIYFDYIVVFLYYVFF